MPEISLRRFRRKEADSSTINTETTRFDSFEADSSHLSRATTVTDDGHDDGKGAFGFNLLYTPSEPLVDFVFVHGLGGGSRKTWSKTSSVTHYWPQEWLPRDPAFKNVRVHSFGYNSDWAAGKDNCLNIHDFGKSLLVAISTSPYLGEASTPIVLIGHSMGGLVIKKAYMLARQDNTHSTLANRFRAIIFLATPHRGSNSAKLLNDILQAAYSSRAYVADLKQDSDSIKAINDEFRKYSMDVGLWSFYETQKLQMGGVFNTLIVDPESAKLGYPQETQIPMNADHRSICKFDTPSDPNYLVVRNVLASIVNNISKSVINSRDQLRREQAKALENYLFVSEPDDDFITAGEARLPGTCEWFSDTDTFSRWKDPTSEAPPILWVNGKPATGKSVLAGYIVDQIQSMKVNCNYFFFKFSDKSKTLLGACLRSLAFQMARNNTEIREKILQLKRDDIQFDKSNGQTIWRKLFITGIFRARLPTQFWVIDALDECVDSDYFFDQILSKLNLSIPLRILVISRETPELQRRFSSLGNPLCRIETISAADILPDIKLLVEARSQSLNVEDEAGRHALVDKIVNKSRGSFLWTVLVLKELSNSFTEEDINQVLDDVPRDMELLYQRTLDLMSQNKRGKNLAITILTWTTCVTRPLTTAELDGALKLDVKSNFLTNIEEAITALCGQLVTIDRLGKVQVVHETAREFLLGTDLQSEFSVNKREAHTRIAKSCLDYLTGDAMKPSRNPKRGPVDKNLSARKFGFSLYACTAFSYHLAQANPLSHDLLVLVGRFLKTNVLSWIEFVAQTQDLAPLIRTARDLRKYLKSCSVERSPLGMEMHTIRSWTIDFTRIAARFANALLISPSSIYSLVLPFCPTDSAVFKTANMGRRLSVVGYRNTQWDERLSCIDFHHGQASAVCHGDEFFAFGLTSGKVALYHLISCQEYKILDHGEAVKFLQFKPKSDLLASCGMRTIRVWDVRSGHIVHQFQSPQPALLAFDKDMLLVASQKNYLASWDLNNDGVRQPDRKWSDSGEPSKQSLFRPPTAISISVDHKMMAIAYSGRPVVLWDLETDSFYGICGKKLPSGEPSTHVVSSIVLNPNENIRLLAVSYLDGDLALIDPFADLELETFRANCHTLAASPDGRLLAGGAGSGVIHIYEFDTLRPLYRVKSSNFYIKQLSFSKDGLHLADVRGSQCNIWEPAALLRDLVSDGSSEDTSTTIFESVEADDKPRITAIHLHPKGEVAFCGKEDGSVMLYSLKTGAKVRSLYCHKSLVRIISWWAEYEFVVSIDASNGIIIRRLQNTKQEGWIVDQVQLQSRLDCGSSIISVLLGQSLDKFILTTRESDYMWNLSGEQHEARAYPDRQGFRKWIHHHRSPLHMLSIDRTGIRVFCWDTWAEIGFYPLLCKFGSVQLKNMFSYTCRNKWRVLLDLSGLDGSAITQDMQLLDTTPFSILGDTVAGELSSGVDDSKAQAANLLAESLLRDQITAIARNVTHVIGLDGTANLVFLDKHSWVCTANLENLGGSSISYMRHFFVPYDWFSGIRDVVGSVSKPDVLFARNGELAIIKGGLNYSEKVDVELVAGTM